MAAVDPCFISVDVETAGPTPERFSLLAIGACLVDDPETGFYAELQPQSDDVDETALAVSGLSLQRLAAEGEPPSSALARFAEWVERNTPAASSPVFVAFNAPFDWMFIADGFERHLGRNPFGHSALDIKALAMGATGCDWSQTGFAALAGRFGMSASLPHHALEDARLQAELFRLILGASKGAL